MTYGDFKDLTRRTASDKTLLDKAFNIAKNPKYDGCQSGLSSMVYKYFYKTSATCALLKALATRKKFAGGAIKNENMSKKELAEELHKPIIRKFKNRKVHSSFIDTNWDAYLAHMKLMDKFIKGIRFLLCVIDIFSKYAWVIPLEDKKGIAITNAFQMDLIVNQTKNG